MCLHCDFYNWSTSGTCGSQAFLSIIWEFSHIKSKATTGVHFSAIQWLTFPDSYCVALNIAVSKSLTSTRLFASSVEIFIETIPYVHTHAIFLHGAGGLTCDNIHSPILFHPPSRLASLPLHIVDSLARKKLIRETKKVRRKTVMHNQRISRKKMRGKRSPEKPNQ